MKTRPYGAAALTGLLAAAMLAACASTPQPPPTRQACLTELVHAYDVVGMIDRSQTESLADAHRAIERVATQYAELLARLSSEQRARFDAATDRFVIAARVTPNAPEAEAVWAQSYAADLSDEDLRKIVEFSRTPGGEEQLAAGGYASNVSTQDLKQVTAFMRTPAGQKQIAASTAAASALRAYLAQQRSARLDQALQQYLAQVKALSGGN
jgi:hypothetical protein